MGNALEMVVYGCIHTVSLCGHECKGYITALSLGDQYCIWLSEGGINHREHFEPFFEGFPRKISCFECENRKAEKILHQPNDFYLIRTRNRLKPSDPVTGQKK